MMLRRVTEHVKGRNWAAVALEFVIVVVGVFIGIQASNCNEARVERQSERRVLEQLFEESQTASAYIELILYRAGAVERGTPRHGRPARVPGPPQNGP